MKGNLIKARSFSAVKHQGQKDDEGNDYYMNHLFPVCEALMQLTNDEEIIMAGILHDTLEDTDTTYEELKKEFGQRVADLVNELTHEGKKDNYGYYFPRLKSKEAIMIKLIDRASNISRMENWDEKRKGQYLKKTTFWKDGSDLSLKKVYQCGQCGKLHKNKEDVCCANFELEESFQCLKCGKLFSENWKHKCEDTKDNKQKVSLYCKNPKCFNHYLVNNKIKNTQDNKEVKAE